MPERGSGRGPWLDDFRRQRSAEPQRCLADEAEERRGGDGSPAFRLVTYNIHRAIGVDRRFRPDRIVHILAEHDPDVVLLQVVD